MRTTLSLARTATRSLLPIALAALLGAPVLAQNLGAAVDLSASAATGYPADVFVTLGDHFFAPDVFTMKVGQTVRFHLTTSGYQFDHDFLIVPEGSDSILAGHPSVVPYGATAVAEWTPTAPGNYRIVCALCPWMNGVIHVLA